jgi:hypothetical protein
LEVARGTPLAFSHVLVSDAMGIDRGVVVGLTVEDLAGR